MKAITTAFVIIIVVSVFNSCYYDNEEYLYPGSADNGICEDSTFTYSDRISSIISGNCSGSTCHNQLDNGRVNLTTFSIVSSNKEEIVCRVVEGATCNQGNKMPPTGNLSTCDIEAFSLWQQNGYPQ